MYEYLRALPPDCLGGTDGDTFTAVDTLVVADFFDVHLAARNAETAVRTLVFIEFYAEKRDFIEEAVQRTERAQEAAEKAVNKDAQHRYGDQDREFPGKQAPDSFIEPDILIRIQEDPDAAAQSARRADKFTKCRHRDLTR